MGLFSHLRGHKETEPTTATIVEGPPPIPARNYGLTPVRAQVSVAGTNDMFSSTPLQSTGQPPVSSIQLSNIHPVKLPRFYDSPGPLQTNNFYGNFLVDDQNLPVWTHPYSVWKSTDDQFKGLGIAHTTESQRVFGDDPNSNPVKYFFNPVGICSLMLSAAEFQTHSFEFLVGECKRFSIGLKFGITDGEMKVKLVQGMGFITGVYRSHITPRIASKVGIQSWQAMGQTSNGLNKSVLTLFDQTKWIVYSNAAFVQESPHSFVSSAAAGNLVIVQVAKLDDEASIHIYDQVAGSYVTDCFLSGSPTGGNTAQYSFNYTVEGSSQTKKPLQWFLPHHYESASQETLKTCASDNFHLDSTVKGKMHPFITDKFTMNENLPPSELLFNPWSESHGVIQIDDSKRQLIHSIAQSEVNDFDVINQSNTDSMYTAGKILDKGAFILYTVAFILGDANLTQTMLHKMKTAFDRFINNQQQAPLVYETNWKGIVSTSGLNDGNFYCDFGNCFYNDHHFHYGYHIHAAAIVALVDNTFGDKSWLQKSQLWVETLIRDIFNTSEKDSYFPLLRSFDFFNGHSFANGLFAHGDGKDEESSSEDYHCYYGIKLWASITNNQQLNDLSSLVLSIEKRAMGIYMLYTNDNKVMPSNFIRNKVSGILFENKVDHATYFGMNKEYIHGIHMIPLTPISNFVRSTKFVNEEWNEMALGNLANSIDGGWKGLLMLNSAIIDPSNAWNFFAQPQFDYSWLDNGMSRTWSLAYCAGMGA